MVVAVLALFVALAAAAPGPAASAAGLVSVQPGTFSLAIATAASSPGNTFSVTCPAGAKAVNGGYTGQQDVDSFDSTISSDGATWTVLLVNFDTTAAATGTLHAVCVK